MKLELIYFLALKSSVKHYTDKILINLNIEYRFQPHDLKCFFCGCHDNKYVKPSISKQTQIYFSTITFFTYHNFCHKPSPNMYKHSRNRSKKHEEYSQSLNDDIAEKQRRRKSSINSSSTRKSLVVDDLVLSSSRPSSSDNRMGTPTTVPIMANFEEWMRLVKDNKINANNSWNFALIDYFHDMSVLKEGDGINFQKASYTLDGCVKIYTSRVDSVASETGKLLSGLTNNSQEKNNEENIVGDDNDNEESEEKQKKRRRKYSSDTTLAKSFEQIKVKSLDLELAVDSLFRKICTDFNEGGASSLLLNSLQLNGTGKVVFDGQDDFQELESLEHETSSLLNKFLYKDGYSGLNSTKVFLESLSNQFLPNTLQIDSLSICPALPLLEGMISDPTSEKVARDMEALRLGEEFMGIPQDPGMIDMDSDGGYYDILGTGGDYDDIENDGDIDPNQTVSNIINEEVNLESASPNNVSSLNGHLSSNNIDSSYSITMLSGPMRATDIMAYFDQSLKSNWAGPEHWKVKRVKGLIGLASNNEESTNTTEISEDISKKPVKKSKDPFLINFKENFANDETELFATGGQAINLTKSQRVSKDLNMLPPDQHFSSKDLVKLFLKPKANLITSSKTEFGFHNELGGISNNDLINEDEINESFFVKNMNKEGHTDIRPDFGEYAHQSMNHNSNNADSNDDDNDDYFGGLDFGGTDFDDVPENPVTGLNTHLIENGPSDPNVRSMRSEYVTYAKSAKRVNVKLLKENVWKVLDISEPSDNAIHEDADLALTDQNSIKMNSVDGSEKERHFTDVIEKLQYIYSPKDMEEISTSFCFISLLHLANEKGLILRSTDDFSDLVITQDLSVSKNNLSA